MCLNMSSLQNCFWVPTLHVEISHYITHELGNLDRSSVVEISKNDLGIS